MKKLLPLLLLLTPLFTFGQNNPYSVKLEGADSTYRTRPKKTDTLKVGRFSAGLNFCQQDSYRYLRADLPYSVIMPYLNTIELAKWGFTSGMNFAYRANKNLTLEWGAWLSNQGYQFSGDASNNVVIAGINGQPNVQVIVAPGVTLNYYYLTIPLKADIGIPLGRASIYLSVGLAANISIGQEAEDGGLGVNSTLDPEAFPNFTWANLATILGAGINIPVSRMTYLKIEPSFTRSFTPAVNGAIKEYTYSVGLNMGVFIYP